MAKHLTLLSLTVLVLLAGHLRLQSVIHTHIDDPLRADAGDYAAYAENLRNHRTYSRERSPGRAPVPDAMRFPGYPLFLSLIMRGSDAFEEQVLMVCLVQALASVVAVILAFLIARSALGDAAGLAAALLVGASPHLVVANSYILSEAIFCTLVLVGVLCAVRLAHTPGRTLAFVTGAAFGAAALTRPWLQFFVVVICLWAFFDRPRDAKPGTVPLIALGFVLVFGAWLTRNVVTLGSFGDSTLMINGLHHGMYPDFMYDGQADTYGSPYRGDPRAQEIGRSVGSVLAEIAARFRDEPVAQLNWYLLGKPSALLSWSIIQGSWDIFVYPPIRSPYFSDFLFHATQVAMKFLHAPLMVLSVIGAALAWAPARLLGLSDERHRAVRFVSLLYLYFLAIHVITTPYPRYAIPMRPLSYLLAIFVLVAFVGALARRIGSSRG